MIALARVVLARIPDLPLENPFSALPDSGRVPGSERLIRGPVGLQPFYSLGEGDILELNGKIFAVLAEYRDGDEPPFHRLVVAYPTPAASAAVLKNLRANLDPYLEVVSDRPDGFDFKDFQNQFGRVERRDSRLEIGFKRTALRGE